MKDLLDVCFSNFKYSIVFCLQPTKNRLDSEKSEKDTPLVVNNITKGIIEFYIVLSMNDLF